MKTTNKKSGFSLVEMIVVIVIIGIIAAIAVPKLLSTKDEATASSIKQDIATAVSAIRSYYLMNGTITSINQAVNLNNKNWTFSDNNLTATFTETNACVTIKVTPPNLTVTLDTTNDGSVCAKLETAGVTSQIYALK
jgi:general secretion pathway protein G